MLCTKIRLADRRNFSVNHHQTQNSSEISGLIQRPCQLKNIENKNKNFVRIPTDKTTNKQTPRLVIYSLKMQSDVKTLVQEDIKRDPRRMPAFCELYKQSKRENQQPQTQQIARNENLNNLIVVGRTAQDFDIQNTTIDAKEEKNDEFAKLFDSDNNFNFNYFDCDDKNMMLYSKDLLNFQLTDCCQCMSDGLFKNNLPLAEVIELPNSKASHQNQIEINDVNRNELAIKSFPFLRCRSLNKSPSPRTRQIINIELNTRK